MTKKPRKKNQKVRDNKAVLLFELLVRDSKFPLHHTHPIHWLSTWMALVKTQNLTLCKCWKKINQNKNQRRKSHRWRLWSRMWTWGTQMGLIPPKTLELNVDGSPGVSIRSFSLGWAGRQVSDFFFTQMKSTSLHIKHQTFQWSLDGVMSRGKKAPRKTKKKQNTAAVVVGEQDAPMMENMSSSWPFNLFFFLSPSLRISFCSPRWAQMQSVTHSLAPTTLNLQHTLVPWCNMQDNSLTPHRFQEIVHTRPDWLINECKQTPPTRSLPDYDNPLCFMDT